MLEKELGSVVSMPYSVFAAPNENSVLGLINNGVWFVPGLLRVSQPPHANNFFTSLPRQKFLSLCGVFGVTKDFCGCRD